MISSQLLGEGLRVEHCPVVFVRVHRIVLTRNTTFWNIHNLSSDCASASSTQHSASLSFCTIAGEPSFWEPCNNVRITCPHSRATDTRENCCNRLTDGPAQDSGRPPNTLRTPPTKNRIM